MYSQRGQGKYFALFIVCIFKIKEDKIMGKDRSMAIKHAKAKKEAMKEVLNDQNDFAQTSWGLTDNMRKWFKAKPYALTYGK